MWRRLKLAESLFIKLTIMLFLPGCGYPSDKLSIKFQTKMDKWTISRQSRNNVGSRILSHRWEWVHEDANNGDNYFADTFYIYLSFTIFL